MSYQFIQKDAQLAAYLKQIRSTEWIAFDTEFISEGRHQAELCLLQVATQDGPVLIDPFGISDLTPFWEFLCSGLTVVAHSCRSELEFCYRALGKVPQNLFDVQLAAGFVSDDYPSSFKKIAEEFLHIEIPKGETRSDWHRRPLSLLQVEYALNDVIFLDDLVQTLTRLLKKKGRYGWFEEETQAYIQRLISSFEGEDQWHRLGGITGFSRQELGIVKALWFWREKKASQSGQVVGRVLRDDLIVELARRKTSDPERIALLRGLGRRSDIETLKIELSQLIGEVLTLPESQLPEIPFRESYPSYHIVSQFLMSFLHNETKRQGLALNLLASMQDVRDFIALKAGKLPQRMKSRLNTGWRRNFLNGLLDALLDGRTALIIPDFTKEEPIETLSVKLNR